MITATDLAGANPLMAYVASITVAAADGNGSLTLTPTDGTTGVANTQLVFTFTAGGTFTSGSQMRI